jgi:hypothetical protein
MPALRTFCVSSSLALMLLAVLLPAQQQPRVPPDPRTLETRYELAYPWWDANRGTPLPPSKTFGDPSGQLRLLNTSGAVETNGHPFFTPLLYHLSPAHQRHEPFARSDPPPLG